MPKPWMIGPLAFVSGVVVTSGAWTAFPPKAAVKAEAASASAEPESDDAIKRANANLTAALHECDRRLTDLGEHPVGPVPSATAAEAPVERDGGGRGRRRGEPTKEDWERMAENGVVRTRVPCIRDKAWTPSPRVVERLGLAPSDTEALKEAYEASNKRMTEQIRPLCAQALGSPELVDKVGVQSCVDVIQNTARKSNAEATKASLTKVAEVHAGKRDAPKTTNDLPPVEQLAFALTNESKAFEKDLTQRLGPDDAKRLITAPELCSDRHMLRAGDVEPGESGRRR